MLRIGHILRAGCALPEPFLQHQARPPAKGAGMSAGGSGDECSERDVLVPQGVAASEQFELDMCWNEDGKGWGMHGTGSCNCRLCDSIALK